MSPRVLSFIVAAVAYGITLTIADIVLTRMRVPFFTGLLAWALFTLSITLLRPILTRTLSGSVHGYTWVIGLVTVLLSLIITTWLTPMRISGFMTWVWATLIVWVGTLVYDMVDDRLVKAARPIADKVQGEIRDRFDRPGGPAAPPA